jgi:hypothetical protein
MFAVLISFFMSFFSHGRTISTTNNTKATINIRSSSMDDTLGETSHIPNH